MPNSQSQVRYRVVPQASVNHQIDSYADIV